MTALPFLMPSYGAATALSGLLALTTSIAIVARFRKYITPKRLLPILLTFIIVSAIAICLLTRIEGRTMRIVLGVLLILISLYFCFFKDMIRQYIRPTLPTQIGAGTLSGIMGGLFGYMAMTQTYFLIGNAMMTLVRAYNGFVTPTVGITYLYALGGVLLGTLADSWAFRHIPNRIFSYVVYGYIGLSGVIILLTA